MARKKKSETLTALSEEQVKVVEHMVEGETVAESARLAGCTALEVEVWLQTDSHFVAALNGRQNDQYRANVDRLRSLAGEAVDALSELIQSENESVRLKAATAVLKSVDLAQVDKPKGATTAAKVKRKWERDSLFEF